MVDVSQFGANGRNRRRRRRRDRTSAATGQTQRRQLRKSSGSSELKEFSASEILHKAVILDALSGAKVGPLIKTRPFPACRKTNALERDYAIAFQTKHGRLSQNLDHAVNKRPVG